MDSVVTRRMATLGPAGLELAFSGGSDPGPSRALNEDAWLAQPPVFVVADGMGGHRGGQHASLIVIEEFGRLATEEQINVDSVEACVEECQRRITDLSDGEPESPGSTMVSVNLIEEGGRDYWLIANVGDSRAYMLQHGVLEQMSHDHSVVQELVDSGSITVEQVATHPQRHVITRALGGSVDFEPDYSLVPAEPGQRVLISSDGVVAELGHHEIRDCLVEENDPADAVLRLVHSALAAGGRDNATAVVIDVLGLDAEVPVDTRPALDASDARSREGAPG